MVAALTGLAILPGSAQMPTARTFTTDRIDQAPSDFTLGAMRQPSSGVWLVQRQGSRSFLAHRSDPSAAGYALALLELPVAQDATVSARMRLAGGERSGGLAWRYEDADNFYALVLNLSRQDLSLFRMAGGNRVRLDVETGLELDPDAWHALKVTHGDGEIRVWLGGIRVFDERDKTQARTTDAGRRAGFLATGRSEAWFEEIRLEPRRSRR